MPIDFEQILKDEKSFPGTMELTVGDQKIPLSDLRELSKKQQQLIADQLNVVQREREMVTQRQKEAAEMNEKATSVYNTLQAQLDAQKDEQARNQARQQTGGYDPEQLYQTDIWYQPIRKRDQATEELLKKIQEKVDLIGNTVGTMGRVYTEDRLANEWESTAEARKRSKALADWDLPKLRKYAEENKIQDKLGFASIREAVNRLTENERQQETSDAAYQRGLREGEMRARMYNQPRPGSANAAMPGGGNQPKSLDEALAPDSIAADEELTTMLNELQNQGANFLTK